ncbi:MAG: hypothetical protein AAF340_00195 [Pseudomonadota bacterium]
MTQLNAVQLDEALRDLIADPDKFDEVKDAIQRGQSSYSKRARLSETRHDEFDDMFDNMPV